MARMASNNIDAVLCDIVPQWKRLRGGRTSSGKGGVNTIALTGFGTEQDV